MISMTALKFYVFDPRRQLEQMSAEEVLTEYLYLQTGGQDETHERSGARLSTPPEIRTRIEKLEKCILESLERRGLVEQITLS